MGVQVFYDLFLEVRDGDKVVYSDTYDSAESFAKQYRAVHARIAKLSNYQVLCGIIRSRYSQTDEHLSTEYHHSTALGPTQLGGIPQTFLADGRAVPKFVLARWKKVQELIAKGEQE